MRLRRQRTLEPLENRRCMTVAFPILHNVDTQNMESTLTIESVDFDGDGDMDVLSTSWAERKAELHLNDGSGNFQPITLPGTYQGPFSIAGGDIDNDGQLDVVVGDFEAGTLHWLKSTRLGNQIAFGEPREIGRTLTELRKTLLVDIDGDQDLDVVVANRDQVNVFENRDGRGDFSARRNLVDSGWATVRVGDIDIGDLNRDGHLDIILGAYDTSGSQNQPLLALYQNGSGGFSLHQLVFGVRGHYRSIAAGDFDKDGHLDIAYAEDSGQIGVWTQNDDGSFIHVASVASDLATVRDITAKDIDLDGDLDLVMASMGADRVSVAFGEPDRDFLFRQPVIVLNAVDPRSLGINDMDGDGDLDILVGIEGGSRSQIVWLEQRVLGDSNNDGRFDSSDLVAVFQAGEYEDAVAGNSTFATGDWNGDGEFSTADLVAAFQAGAYNAAAVARNVDVVFAGN